MFLLHSSATAAPAAISTFSVKWTAPGDDGVVGRATGYDLRYSTSSITAANFAQAVPLPGLPMPGVAGSTQSFTVSGLNAGTTYYLALKAVDEVGNWSAISNVYKKVASTTGARAQLTLSFSEPWPNPVRASMTCAFSLPETAPIRVEVFDLSGRLMQTLANGPRAAGSSELVWNLADRNGQAVQAGVYLLRAQLGPQTWTRRVSVIR
ncbi:MAG: FlgD immunoglobulin-like domain containing protein [Candidatus Eisenbacteria bacterium]